MKNRFFTILLSYSISQTSELHADRMSLTPNSADHYESIIDAWGTLSFASGEVTKAADNCIQCKISTGGLAFGSSYLYGTRKWKFGAMIDYVTIANVFGSFSSNLGVVDSNNLTRYLSALAQISYGTKWFSVKFGFGYAKNISRISETLNGTVQDVPVHDAITYMISIGGAIVEFGSVRMSWYINTQFFSPLGSYSAHVTEGHRIPTSLMISAMPGIALSYRF